MFPPPAAGGKGQQRNPRTVAEAMTLSPLLLFWVGRGLGLLLEFLQGLLQRLGGAALALLVLGLPQLLHGGLGLLRRIRNDISPRGRGRSLAAREVEVLAQVRRL